MRDERHLARAVQVALVSTQRMRHGAVIAHGNRVLAVGVNLHRAHPLNVSDPKTQSAFHAEVAALRALRTTVPMGRLSLYSARVNKSNEPVNALPCANCWAVLDYLGITDVHWTTDPTN